MSNKEIKKLINKYFPTRKIIKKKDVEKITKENFNRLGFFCEEIEKSNGKKYMTTITETKTEEYDIFNIIIDYNFLPQDKTKFKKEEVIKCLLDTNTKLKKLKKIKIEIKN